MAKKPSETDATGSVDLQWESLSNDQLEAILKQAATEKRERANRYMDPVKQNNLMKSAERATTRLLQIYRIFTEGDDKGKVAREEKLAGLVEMCATLVPDKIAESAKQVPYVKKLRGSGSEGTA